MRSRITRTLKQLTNDLNENVRASRVVQHAYISKLSEKIVEIHVAIWSHYYCDLFNKNIN